MFASLCGIWIASLHQFRNCLVPLLRSSVCVDQGGTTPPGERAQLHQRHGVQPLLGTPPSCASRCVEFWMDGWNNHWSIQLQIVIKVQVIQSPDEQHSVFECKKRKANPEVRKSKICSMPPRSGRPATPRGHKARGEKVKIIILCFKFNYINWIKNFILFLSSASWI